MALNDAVGTIINRNAFYRDGYRLMLRISIIQGVVILLLVSAIIAMLVTMQTKYVYFATTSDGRIIDIVPLNVPYKSPAGVIEWASGTATKVMSMGYHDYRQRLQESSSYFTPSGWESFTKALKDARILEAIEARKLVVTLNIEGAPEIKRSGDAGGIYTWYLQIPVTIRYEGAEAPTASRGTLILQIVRVSTLQSPDGISIEQWAVKQGS